MQPVIIEDIQAIAANTVVQNLIVLNASLRRYLRAPFRAKGKLIMVTTAAGIVIDLDYGSKNVVASSTLRVDAGGSMTEPLDVINDAWYVNEGDQLTLRVANTTGAAITVRYRIELEPMGDLEFPPDARVMQLGPIAIAAAAVDVQLLDGLRYERPPVDCLMTLWMTGSAGGLLRQLFVDTDSIAPPSQITPTNRVPQDPFDINVSGVQVEQDKLIAVQVSNPTAGALNVFARVRLQELVRT